MAVRPVYVPETDTTGVIVKDVTFQWFPGFSTAQKQRSIDALHDVAGESGIRPVLEISSKSREELGIQLSAFHLTVTPETSNQTFSVETAFQGSKVFENGGPYTDLLEGTSRQAKKDERLRNSGKLMRFEYFGKSYPLQPRTFFYDWLYLNALEEQPGMAERLMKYQGFTDIEFNPKKSINCQAYSAALYVSILRSGCIEEAMSSPETFLATLQGEYEARDQILAIQHHLE